MIEENFKFLINNIKEEIMNAQIKTMQQVEILEKLPTEE